MLIQRGTHNIEDELIFTNHDGYIFHDSCGFEAGGEQELQIVQDFVRRKSREDRLEDRLHAIWFVPLSIYNCRFTILHVRYCIPMDNARPGLDMIYLSGICPDSNGTSDSNFMDWD
jgi:hypothetical protein